MRKVLCGVEEIPDCGATARDVESSTGGFSILLTRVRGDVHAFHNECPHAARRLDWAPGRFLIEGDTVVCAAHGAQFLLDSGRCIGGPCSGKRLVRLRLEERNGNVYFMGFEDD